MIQLYDNPRIEFCQRFCCSLEDFKIKTVNIDFYTIKLCNFLLLDKVGDINFNPVACHLTGDLGKPFWIKLWLVIPGDSALRPTA